MFLVMQYWFAHDFIMFTLAATSTAHCLQALSALLWRPHGSHSFKPTWNKVHAKWGKATMAVGANAVCLGIHVAGVGWPWYFVFALQAGTILGAAFYIKPLNSIKKVNAAVCFWYRRRYMASNSLFLSLSFSY